jgi:penicillin amidase
MIPEGYPYAVGFEWEPAYRARRIEELLNAAIVQGRKLDVEDMVRVQRDIVSLPARELVKLLSGAAQNAQDAPTKLLLGWDGSVAADSPAAALYEVWVEELERAVYHQLAPEIPHNLIAGHWSLPAVVLQSLRQPDSQTFGSAPEAERDRLLLRTVQAAAERLRQLQGPDPKRWSWGKLHQLSFRHSLNAVLPTSKALFDLGPLERSGDGSTVNAVYFRGAGFEAVSGASYREIFDLGDWDRSLATNTPGQSGQPGSPHYGDLLPMWAEGSYFPLVYSRAAVEKHTTARLRLEP